LPIGNGFRAEKTDVRGLDRTAEATLGRGNWPEGTIIPHHAIGGRAARPRHGRNLWASGERGPRFENRAYCVDEDGLAVRGRGQGVPRWNGSIIGGAPWESG